MPSTDPWWSANVTSKSNTTSGAKSPDNTVGQDWLEHATSSWLTRNLQDELLSKTDSNNSSKGGFIIWH